MPENETSEHPPTGQSSTSYLGVANSEYEPPVPIEVPAVFAWPPRPVAALAWLARLILYPWVVLYLVLSVVIWRWLLPSEATMASLQPGWIAGIWFRNLVLVGVIVGGLHWWLYVRRAQG
ncbi:MAG TPA: hypothetical protein QF651_11355, partial [Acidimicrobiales bacterium]|nr:hypothetical protein [Acidimicrobiales bacterium]